MTIYIVRKHRWSRGFRGVHYSAFEIHGAYKTYAEAYKVAIAKNAKAKDYVYMTRRLVTA